MQRYGKDNAVTKVDKEKKVVTLASGSQIQYDALISTLPLDIMLTWLGKEDWAKGLTRRCHACPSPAPGQRGRAHMHPFLLMHGVPPTLLHLLGFPMVLQCRVLGFQCGMTSGVEALF